MQNNPTVRVPYFQSIVGIVLVDALLCDIPVIVIYLNDQMAQVVMYLCGDAQPPVYPMHPQLGFAEHGKEVCVLLVSHPCYRR